MNASVSRSLHGDGYFFLFFFCVFCCCFCFCFVCFFLFCCCLFVCYLFCFFFVLFCFVFVILLLFFYLFTFLFVYLFYFLGGRGGGGGSRATLNVFLDDNFPLYCIQSMNLGVYLHQFFPMLLKDRLDLPLTLKCRLTFSNR